MLKTLSSLAYVVMVVGILGLAWWRALVAHFVPALILQIAAVALLLWARITFGRRSFHLAANPTEGGLVTTGPYRFIRHPIYTSVCLFTWAAVATHFSWRTLSFGLLVQAGAVIRIICEETLLPLRYPEFKAYAARTWRMVPFVF